VSTVKKQPQRACIGCGRMRDKKDLIRILKTPEEDFIIDASGRKNGRGAYLCPDSECLDKAIRNHGLERSFKMAVPQEVYDKIREEFGHIASK